MHFSSLNDRKQFVPPYTTPHKVRKAEVVPVKVLFKDEKDKSETIEILKQLMSDADLNGDHQVHVQTILTFSHMSGIAAGIDVCTFAPADYCG